MHFALKNAFYDLEQIKTTVTCLGVREQEGKIRLSFKIRLGTQICTFCTNTTENSLQESPFS